MTRLLRRLFFFANTLIFGLILASCSTTPKAPAKKPNAFCYCGGMKSIDNKNYCAIWGDRKRLDLPHKALGAKEQASCTPDDCSKLFSKDCEKMQMWAYEPSDFPKPAADPCYCDSALVEGDKGQVTLVCAAWQKDQKTMIEYFNTKDCQPTTCGQAPFQIAPKLCPQGFRSYYAPFNRGFVQPIPAK